MRYLIRCRTIALHCTRGAVLAVVVIVMALVVLGLASWTSRLMEGVHKFSVGGQERSDPRID
jgi:hypothetical protein